MSLIGSAGPPASGAVGAFTRRQALRALAGAMAGAPAWWAAGALAAAPVPELRLALFTADVTVPLGHPLMGGGIAPAARIDDPLTARGLALLGGEKPIIIVSVDWCEIRNDAHDRWRQALAEAAGTDPERVLVSCVHVHDAPVADLTAERLLQRDGGGASIVNLEFHEEAVGRAARALRSALETPRRVTHVGTGQARVERIASNRRYLAPGGRVLFGRTSATRDEAARAADEGTTDPSLRVLSFWDGETPLAALSAYATHPMSYYGKGGVSSDFPGLARKRREAEIPGVAQIYLSGASGNVTAGKYNDGSPENREALAARLCDAMGRAWKETRRSPLERIGFRSVKLSLEPRGGPGFTEEDLRRRLASDSRPFGRCLAALGLSWRRRTAAGRPIDMPAIDLGRAQLLLLPAESYVEYQLFAQAAQAQVAGADSFVVSAGYGECGPGYIPTETAWKEGDTNLGDWCWVAPGAQARLEAAIRAALATPAGG